MQEMEFTAESGSNRISSGNYNRMHWQPNSLCYVLLGFLLAGLLLISSTVAKIESTSLVELDVTIASARICSLQATLSVP
jgi:hypothetical protein